MSKIEKLNRIVEQNSLHLDKIQLYPWQQTVVDKINEHDSLRESEQYQGMPDYTINKALGVSIALPKGSGHTLLSNYIAAKIPSIVVYGNMNHYKEICKYPLHPDSETISCYEIFYALYKPDVMSPSKEFLELRQRFNNKKVIVIDNAQSTHNEIKEFLFGVAHGPLVCLGH